MHIIIYYIDTIAGTESLYLNNISSRMSRRKEATDFPKKPLAPHDPSLIKMLPQPLILSRPNLPELWWSLLIRHDQYFPLKWSSQDMPPFLDVYSAH